MYINHPDKFLWSAFILEKTGNVMFAGCQLFEKQKQKFVLLNNVSMYGDEILDLWYISWKLEGWNECYQIPMLYLLFVPMPKCDPLRRNETCPPDLTFIDMYTRLTSNSRAFQWYKCYFRSLFHSGIIERWREPSLCGPFRFWISRFGENQH